MSVLMRQRQADPWASLVHHGPLDKLLPVRDTISNNNKSKNKVDGSQGMVLEIDLWPSHACAHRCQPMNTCPYVCNTKKATVLNKTRPQLPAGSWQCTVL